MELLLIERANIMKEVGLGKSNGHIYLRRLLGIYVRCQKASECVTSGIYEMAIGNMYLSVSLHNF